MSRLGTGRPARGQIEPVVGGAEADEEEQGHGDKGHDRDRVTIDDLLYYIFRFEEGC